MTPAEVHALAVAAGLDSDSAVIATAIAWAESGLNPSAVGDVDLQDSKWGPSFGLWQIRSLKAHLGTGKERDSNGLKQPAFNAASMASISADGTNWTPWSVFKNGRYLEHLDAVRAAVGGTPMRFVSREEWGARHANTSTNITPEGVAIHWEGPHMGTPAHVDCAPRVRGIQSFHMEGNGWADVAYSAIVCPHGSVFEGRGRGHRTAANGTNDGNQRYYAVCYLGGEGDPFTEEAQTGINDAIEWLGGGEIVGHRDLTSTACPGEEIYAWVQAGHPSPGGPPAPPPPHQEELTMIVFDGPPERGGGVWKSDGVFRNRVRTGDTWPALEAAGAKHIGVAPVGLFDDLVDIEAVVADLWRRTSAGDSDQAGGVDLSAIADRVAARVADLLADRLRN